MAKIENSFYELTCSGTGAVTVLRMKQDPYRANFVLSTEQEPWVPESKQWGLGFLTAGAQRLPFDTAAELRFSGDSMTARYELRYDEPRFGCVWSGDRVQSTKHHHLELLVTRALRDERIEETYELWNRGTVYAVLDEIGLYTSFHDTYAAGENALEMHVNQHFWMGGDLSYIEAQRQSGNPPHLGLIGTEGRFTSYQVEELNSSNFRGVIAAMAKDVRVAPGACWRARRVLVPFRDRAEFERLICRETGYPILDYGQLTVHPGERFRFRILDRGQLQGISIHGRPMEERDGYLEWEAGAPGEYTGETLFAGGKLGTLRVRVIDSDETLLHSRARFIMEHQQLLDRNDPRYGAYLSYDNRTKKLIFLEDVEKLYYGVPDRNEARERLGMGAFLAAYARAYGDESVLPSLRLYCAFVEKYLIDENYDVWDSYERQAGVRYYMDEMKPLTETGMDMRFRTFNYDFMLAFLSEMYWLTREKHYAELCAGIMERYAEKYKTGGNTCMFGVDSGTVRAVRDAGMPERADRLLGYLHERAAYLRKIDDNYDPSEVIYEQGTSASAMREVADYYLQTKDASFLPILEKEKARTMAFEGAQPDYRCYHAPTIHWDDFWFGGLEMWGDTMPHYWDTISADAYCMYAQITGQQEYVRLADVIFRNNLALINPDGSCWNCFIYPEKVNGRQGARLEPWANDQDWAFYTYLKTRELLGRDAK